MKVLCYSNAMRLLKILGLLVLALPWEHSAAVEEAKRPVYVIPIRDDIEQSIVYVVRRGLKEATEHDARAVMSWPNPA